MNREEQREWEESTDLTARVNALQRLKSDSLKGKNNLPRARALLGAILPEVEQHLAESLDVRSYGTGGKYKDWVRQLPTNVAAVIAIQHCVRLLSGNKNLNSHEIHNLSSEVGREYVLEARIRMAQVVAPISVRFVYKILKDQYINNPTRVRRMFNKSISRVFDGELNFSLSRGEYIQIGKFGIDACWKAGLIDEYRVKIGKGYKVRYRLVPEVYEFLTGYNDDDVSKIVNPDSGVMLCAPDVWTNNTNGGYLTAYRKVRRPLLTSLRIPRGTDLEAMAAMTYDNMPAVFDAVNYLQSTAFTIHQPTREAIVRLYRSGGGVMGIPGKNPPIPPDFPFGEDFKVTEASPDEVRVFENWKGTRKRFYRLEAEWKAKVLEVGQLFRNLNSEVIQKHPEIWFPMYLDSRGRMYYRGVINPQGSDMARAVIHMHEKRPLGPRGVYWLKVGIANSFGYDKVRFDQRCAWTEENWGKIESALDCPEDHPEVWGDSPWCMFSLAWELREAYRSGNPERYETGCIVHMDATCSGLAHYSALLLDPVGGQYTNLIDMGTDRKQDIYSKVASVAMQAVEQDLLHEDREVRDMASWVLEIGINRTVAKRPVMVKCYSATLHSASGYVWDAYDDEVLPSLGLDWPQHLNIAKLTFYIAQKLFTGIQGAVPAAYYAMEWLNEAMRVYAPPGVAKWRTPSGFLVHHDYRIYKQKRIKINAAGITSVLYREETDVNNRRSMASSIAPNFIHSMDASHLVMTANSMAKEGLPMVGIHDSFGTHPSCVDSMHRIIRDEFSNIYRGTNWLSSWGMEVLGRECPLIRGSLDIDKCKESEFMFC
jgi:DNA-directed RNA polymerase